MGRNLIHHHEAERLQLFLVGYLAMYFVSGVLLPLWEYEYVLRSPWLLAIVVACTAQCVVLVVALLLARHSRYQQSITLACIGQWVVILLITFIAPALLPVMVLSVVIDTAPGRGTRITAATATATAMQPGSSELRGYR